MNNIFFKTSSGYVDYIRRDGFTINLINPIFSDENFKFWSYPYEDYMTDEFKREFQDLSLLNKSKFKNKYEGQLFLEGSVYDATLEVISTDRNLVKKQIDFGYKKLNYTDFKINELNYGEINALNIYYYVDSVLDKTYPEINHCFPRIQTTEFEREENGNIINNCPIINDVYDKDNTRWYVLNLRTIRPFEMVDYKEIINILKPFIFLLEILKKGFEKLGYNLEGDILNDDDFRFLCLDNDGVPYESFKFEEKKEKLVLSLPREQDIIEKYKIKTIGGGRLNFYYYSFFSTTEFDQGDYQSHTTNRFTANVEIKINYKALGSLFSDIKTIYANDSAYNLLYSIEIPIDTNFVEIEIEIKYNLEIYDENLPFDYIEIQFNPIKQVGFQDSLDKGDEIKIMKNRLILSDFVPAVNFSDILDFLKKYGYIAIPKGKNIYMNKIYFNNDNSKDFTFSEVMYPEIIPYNNDAKIIKLSSYDKLKYGKLTICNEGLFINSEKDFEKKEEIIINALPLPFVSIEKKVREYFFENDKLYVVTSIVQDVVIKEEKDSDSEIRLIKYRGVFNSKNDGLDISHLLPENAINTYFKNEIKFFHSDNIKWTFISSSEEFKNLKVDDKIFAYKRELVIKNLTKTFIGENLYQIDFDTLSIL